MMAQEKHWFNPNLLAPNVMEIDVDPCVFAPASALAREVQAITGCSHQARLGSGLALHVHSMATEWDSDMLWISHSDVESFTFFENLFRASRIAELVTHHIDYKDTIQLYSGFFVSRGRCTKPNFHFDWIDANNNAFTFLMPLTSNCQDMGLTYITVRGDQAEYRYRPNKALLFGDFFYHSTAPGETAERCVLLSFTFGTDKMEHWPAIAQTAAAQGRLHRRPDGNYVRDGELLSQS